MPVSQAKLATNKRYRQRALESISFQVKKGLRESYRQSATELGLSLASFFKLAADEYAHKKHDDELIIRPPAPKPTDEQRRLLEVFNTLSPAARYQLIKFLESLSG